MAVESQADLAAFINTDEFADSALLHVLGGPLPVRGIVDTYADSERPGGTSRSSISSWVVGAADIRTQPLQFTGLWGQLQQAGPEGALEITSGDYAGTYRIVDVQRDGALCRLMLGA